MRIFFDYQTFALQNYGGISRYFVELINGINKSRDDSAYLPILLSNNIHLQEARIKTKIYTPEYNFYKKLQITYRSNQIYNLVQLYRKPYDIFHATYYDPYFLPYLKSRPFVVTFLDMINEKLSGQFAELNDGGVITNNKRILANRANRIIAISESTKRDIVDLFNVDPSKIDVIYLGNSLIPKPFLGSQLNIKIPYLLFVGNRSMYKNFVGLLESIHTLLKKHSIKLLCAGGGIFTKSELILINSLGVDRFVEQCSINDQILPSLYQNATAFVFPTYYEGFGIPILEAFACECPCVVSNGSSLPEVAGDAALYIDPSSPESIVYAVERIITDSELRKTLISRGRERLAQFSWKHTIDKTIDVYRSIV